MRSSALLVLTTVFVLSTHEARSATFWVTNSDDSGPGSLRQALTDMNAAAGDDHEIRFDLPLPAAPIVLESLLPPPNKPNVLIAGPSFDGDEPLVIIDGADSFRIFQTHTGVSNRHLNLQRLQLRNGRSLPGAHGGCISISHSGGPGEIGTLTLGQVVLRDCVAPESPTQVSGGAVFVFDRTVVIDRSRFEGNEAAGNGGALFLQASQLSGTSTFINGSSFLDNRAGSPFIGNNGGAIRAFNVDLYVEDSRFIGNETYYSGGQPGNNHHSSAIGQQNGQIRLERSMFFHNRARFTTVSTDFPNESGWAVARNNVFVANDVGAGSAFSAGHYRVEFRNNTVLDSRTDTYFRPTAIFQFYSGGHPDARLVLANNLFGPSQQAGHMLCGTSSNLTTIEAHYNIAAGAGLGCGLSADASTLAELAIEALRDNGGSVETVSLFADSPALMAGNPDAPQNEGDLSRCPTLDARRLTRPTDSLALGYTRCDAGAWESNDEAPLFRHDFESVLWRP